MNSKKYVVVDIETTGLSRFKHGITEIAAQMYEDGKVIAEFQTLVNPERHIPPMITRLTGIDNDMVADAPTIHEVMPDFIEFLGDHIFVAHNASFDFNFLDHYKFQTMNCGIENPVLCTRKLANRLLSHLPKKNLGSLCDHFALTNRQAHRAMADVEVTVQILDRFIEMLEANNICDKHRIIEFQNKSIKLL